MGFAILLFCCGRQKFQNIAHATHTQTRRSRRTTPHRGFDEEPEEEKKKKAKSLLKHNWKIYATQLDANFLRELLVAVGGVAESAMLVIRVVWRSPSFNVRRNANGQRIELRYMRRFSGYICHPQEASIAERCHRRNSTMKMECLRTKTLIIYWIPSDGIAIDIINFVAILFIAHPPNIEH